VPIDFSSASGRLLLSALAARQGGVFAALARLPRRTFALRSRVAPGLRFIGAEVETSADTLAPRQTFSLGGTGESMEDALTSCLGEGVERLSQVERKGDITCRSTVGDMRDRLMPSAVALIEQLAGRESAPAIVADWISGAELETGREVAVPADWCLRRVEPGPLAMPNTALSTGVAAGPTPEAAAVRAILELIERDAAAIWWVGGRRGRPVALDEPGMADSASLLSRLRQGVRTRSSWLMDLTTNFEIPCVAAISVSASGDHMACGIAARLSLADAAGAAILEMCQMELAVDVVNMKRSERGNAALNETDRRHLTRAATINSHACDLLHPSGTPRVGSLPQAGGDAAALTILQARFEAIAAAIVDLTRPEYGIPVMAAIAPALQRLPSDLHVARLTTIIDATGGGARWTGGLPLL
jgi:ribosomal protein S12 methylthiotransferase accessory factor